MSASTDQLRDDVPGVGQPGPTGEPLPPVKNPLNLGLNDGVYMPASCVDVLAGTATRGRTSLRNYSTASEHDRLRSVIAQVDGVSPDQVYLHNGSGPILKQVVPYLIRTSIKASPTRVIKHLVSKNGYPIITPRITYGKVPAKAVKNGLTVHMLPVSPETGFKVNPADIARFLDKGDGFVYIVNPNNPTGTVLITRDELVPLLERYPKSRFWIDEAYVQYVDPAVHEPLSDLVSKYDNLFVSRTFSFAYGMAAVRIGYLLTTPALVKEFWGQLTDYRLGTLQEELAVAALTDPDHLPFIRAYCAEQRAILRQGMSTMAGIETFPSQTNFVFARFTDGRKGADLAAALEARGIKIKKISPFGKEVYDEYFRITVGLPHENRLLLDTMTQVVDGLPRG